MLAYASSTGTRRNLHAFRLASWRLFFTPFSREKPSLDFPYALDNGAWSAYQTGEQFNETAFMQMVERYSRQADFAIIPDIVAGGMKSLDFSMKWLPRLAGSTKLLLAVQDGMDVADVSGILSDDVGIFVGGTTEWKLSTMATWGKLARQVGCYLHIGRVNTVRRVALCAAAGADSFDGTSATRFAVNVPRLDNARKQPDMLFEYFC